MVDGEGDGAPAAQAPSVEEVTQLWLLNLRSVSRTDTAAIKGVLRDAEKHFKGQPDPRLKAYESIIEFERSGSVTGNAVTAEDATREIRELETGAFRFEVARALSQSYAERFPDSEKITRLNAYLAGPGSGRADDWLDDRERDIQVVSQPGAKTTVIVFCGLGHNFGIPLNALWHLWLSAYPVNMILLRDRQRMIYLWGISSLGSLDASVAELARLSRSLGAERIVTMGNSAGASGAMLYGTMLGAERCVALAPVLRAGSFINPKKIRAKARLLLLREEGQVEWPDARTTLAASKMKADIFYSADISRDRKQADLVGGLPNVTLHPLSNVRSHHEVPRALTEQRLFRGVLDAALGPVKPRAGRTKGAARTKPEQSRARARN